MFSRRFALVAALLAAGLIATIPPAAAKDPVSTGTFSSLAVSGYDPVADFADGKPVEGSSRHEN